MSEATNNNLIRNFCIIAHIDHGKSTLADRFLEICGAVDERKKREQMLDRMELEKERGITIKAKAVSINYTLDGANYILNLIDTPGHVDFTYEVAKSLKASDGAILLVDATQGVEAQTVANFYLAMENNLKVIPVINKIDLPNADINRVTEQLWDVFGFKKNEISCISAKRGEGVDNVLKRVIKEIPPPSGSVDGPLKAILFDISFDPYRGIILFIRIFEGKLSLGDEILFMHKNRKYKAEDLGIFVFKPIKRKNLICGEVGYVFCNIKDPKEIDVGDTLTNPLNPTSSPFEGYKKVSPMVFCGIFPTSGRDYNALREAIEKLELSDPSFVYEPDSLGSLGHGFRCGFLGLLHMEIIEERIEREYNLDLILTSPNVLYKVVKKTNEVIEVNSPHNFPDPQNVEEVLEPFVKAVIISPLEYMDAVYELSKSRRGKFVKTDYLGKDRLSITFELPLSEVVVDFYDKLKSVTKGYASLDYEFIDYRKTEVSKIDILFNKKKVEAFSLLVNKERAEHKARIVVDKLKELIPRQMFEISIQAAINSKIIASSHVSPLRKNVTAKCYGGDITRKRKLWEKQKEGKKKMKQMGNIQVPRGAFLEVLRM